jgi:hypothetical protein
VSAIPFGRIAQVFQIGVNNIATAMEFLGVGGNLFGDNEPLRLRL